MEQEKTERKLFLDNLRWMAVVLVVVYQIIAMFSCSGVVSCIDIEGIPQMDAFCVYVYPWLAGLLFVIAGMSARYSLERRSDGEFMRERAVHILVPSIVGILAYGWVSGLITEQSVDIWGGEGDLVPGFLKYIVYCITGMDTLWFAHILFVAAVLLVMIRAIDSKERIYDFGEKAGIPAFIILTVLVLGSAQVLNVPVFTDYRFGIYLVLFLLGYFVFSHDEVLDYLEDGAVPLGIVAALAGIAYTYYYYGLDYTDSSCLQSIITNVYLWLAIIAIIACGKRFLDWGNKFTEYMTKNTFSFYLLHFAVVAITSYVIVTYLNLPFAVNYILILICTVILLPLLAFIIGKIPVIRLLVLGQWNEPEPKKRPPKRPRERQPKAKKTEKKSLGERIKTSLKD